MGISAFIIPYVGNIGAFSPKKLNIKYILQYIIYNIIYIIKIKLKNNGI